MNRKLVRPILTVAVLVTTITAFIYYFAKHPSVRAQLRHTSPEVLLLLLLLYFGVVFCMSLVTIATLRLCQTELPVSESVLVTMYSSIVNFFGPLQSGPAFRAVYLKKKHNVNLKNYAVATLMYYLFYALFSGLFLLSGILKWWLIVLVILAIVAFLWLRRSQSKLAARFQQLDLSGWYYLAIATFLQLSLVAIIYFVELRSVSPGVHVGQAIIYSGAADFSLFVSLTPGAIGFRESFLLFSRHLHHISSSSIVAANIIDRSVYIVMLLILAVFIFATHTNRRLKARTED